MFEQAFTAFRIWKIPVKLHISLLLFIPYVAYVATAQMGVMLAALGVPAGETHLPGLAWGLLLSLALFVSIVLHELAHSVIARRSGATVKSITLMMLGGVTRLQGEVRPEREALMAFAGPLVSLFLALIAYAGFRYLPLPAEALAGLLVVAWMNVALGLFNLLPAFPMDGGRVLRGLLVRRIGRSRATKVATAVGKGMAVLLAIYGLYIFNVILVLIGGFVYLGASAEQSRLLARDALHGIPVTQLMTDRVGEAHTGETTGAVARRLLLDNLAGATVVVDGLGALKRIVGVVTATDLAERAARGGWEAPVESAMQTAIPSVHAGDDAEATLDAMMGDEARAVVVLSADERVVGLVTEAEIQRAMALASLRGG